VGINAPPYSRVNLDFDAFGVGTLSKCMPLSAVPNKTRLKPSVPGLKNKYLDFKF